jgi:hypothetical protein
MDDGNNPPDGGNDNNDGRIIKRRKQYPKAVKEAIWDVIVSQKIDGILPHGAIAEIGFSRCTGRSCRMFTRVARRACNKI